MYFAPRKFTRAAIDFLLHFLCKKIIIKKIKIQIRGSQIVASNLILEMTADVWQRLPFGKIRFEKILKRRIRIY